ASAAIEARSGARAARAAPRRGWCLAGVDWSGRSRRIHVWPSEHHYTDLGESGYEAGSDHTVSETSQPSRPPEADSAERVDAQMGAKRQHANGAEFVISEEAVDDCRDAQDDGHPSFGAISEAEEAGCNDQDHANQVVQDTVSA